MRDGDGTGKAKKLISPSDALTFGTTVALF
jgi:hypothetical protein